MICSSISCCRPCRGYCRGSRLFCLWNGKLLVSGFVWLGSEADIPDIPFSWKRIFSVFWLAVSQMFNQSHIAWFKPAKSKSFSLTNKIQVTEKERGEFIGKQNFLRNNFKSLLHWPSRLVHHKMVKTRSRPLTSAFYNKSKVRDDRHSTTFSWILYSIWVPAASLRSCLLVL